MSNVYFYYAQCSNFLSLDYRASADLPDRVLGGASQGWRGLGLHTPGHCLQLASSADDTQSHPPLREWSVVQLYKQDLFTLLLDTRY